MSSADELIHEVYRLSVLYKETPQKIPCKNCGTELKAYYAEDRLYTVKCEKCDYIAIVKANSPSEAAMMFSENSERSAQND